MLTIFLSMFMTICLLVFLARALGALVTSMEDEGPYWTIEEEKEASTRDVERGPPSDAWLRVLGPQATSARFVSHALPTTKVMTKPFVSYASAFDRRRCVIS